MVKLLVPAQAAPFIEELRKLIRTGVAAAPTLHESCLLEIPAVTCRVRPSASPAEKAQTFIRLLERVVRTRLEGKDRETATLLFALGDYAGVPIQERYRAAAKSYHQYWTWENFRKEPLTRHLLAVYLALEREVVVPAIRKLPSEHSGTVGEDWIMELFDGLYTFPRKPGDPFEVVQTRRLRALRENVVIWRHEVLMNAQSELPQPEITVFSKGDAVVSNRFSQKKRGLQGFITEVRFPQPIAQGETIDFTLVKRFQVDYEKLLGQQDTDWYGLLKLLSPVDSIHIALRFPSHKVPRLLWRQEGIVNGLMNPGAPADGNRLAVDASGYSECSWTDMPAGLACGISLQW